MSNRRLDRVGIDSVVCELLARNGITTVGDLLLASPLALMVYADLSLKEVKNIVSKASERVHSKPSSALEILHKRALTKQFSSTGLSTLDVALKGGLLLGSISEISGPPGIGKTQFCLSCTLQTIAQHHLSLLSGGVNGVVHSTLGRGASIGVVYLDTELKFDPNRLVQMAMESFPELYSSEYRTDAPHMVDKLLACVKIIRPTTCKQLGEEIAQLQSVVISQNVSLIVIDSIAALARKEALNERDKELFFMQQSANLKKMAELCSCVVLATNQVTLASGANPSTLYNDAILDSSGQLYQPTLGPTWHHCVSTRLTMSTADGSGDSCHLTTTGSATVKQKYVSITKSPIAGPHTLPFMITSCGLTSVPELVAMVVAVGK